MIKIPGPRNWNRLSFLVQTRGGKGHPYRKNFTDVRKEMILCNTFKAEIRLFHFAK